MTSPAATVDRSGSRPGASVGQRLTPVLLGLVGSVLLTLGVLSPDLLPKEAGYSFPGLGWWHRFAATNGTGLSRGLIFAGTSLLITAWVLLLRLRPQVRLVVLAGVLWVLPLLLAPPIYSQDMFLYGDQGWALWQGHNPYEVGLTESGGPFAALVNGTWHGTTAAYPPLALRGQQLAVMLAGGSVPGSIALMRLTALAGVVLAGWATARLAARRGYRVGTALCWAMLNPVMVIHMVGGGHNDAMMVGLVALAMLLADRRHGWILAAVAAGIASAVKQPGVLVAVPAALLALTHLAPLASRALTWLRGIGIVAAASVVAVASSVLTHLACGLGAGWLASLVVPGSVATWAPSSIVGMVARRGLAAAELTAPQGLDTVVRWGVLAVLALGLLVLAWRWRHNPMVLAGLGFLAFAMAQEGLRTWYLVWATGLLALGGGRRVAGVAAGLLTASLVADAFHEYFRFDMLGELITGTAVGIAVGLAVAAAGWPARRSARPAGDGC